MPSHLPGGKPGSGRPPGRDFGAGPAWASPPGSAAQPTATEGRSSVSTEQRENLEAILWQSAFPAGIGVSEQRRLLRELVSAQPLPAGVTVTAAALGGVPAAEITIGGIEPRRVVVYFHGGVYVLGDAAGAAGLASQVGRRTGVKVISVGYRLAPEHPYPAAVDDALAAYDALLEGGTAPSDIAVAGESAGGGLAVAALVSARDHGLPLPAAAFVMSPYADLTLAGATMDTKRQVDLLMSRENPAVPGHGLYGGTRRRSRPHQPCIRRPARPAAADHPGRNPRGPPRRRRPPRPASRHRRRRGHPRHHPPGAARLPDLLPGPRRSGRRTGQSRTVPAGASRRRRTRHRIAKGRTQGMTDLRTNRGRLRGSAGAGHPVSRSPRSPLSRPWARP